MPIPTSPEAHKRRHVALYSNLQDLITEFRENNPGSHLSEVSLYTLMTWARHQADAPTHDPH
jgi:hypothetical protein